MKIDLRGRRALVLGGAGGVHDTVVATLAGCGAVVDERVPGGSPGLDCGSRDAAIVAANNHVAAHGSPDILVNLSATAGFIDGGTAAAEETDWFVHATRAFAPFASRVINVISVAGLVPVLGAVALSAHHAGLASLTRALAMELAPNVLVNALAVGALGQDGERLLSHSPLKRAAEPAEVGTALLFLAAPRNTYTTGHVMAVDGGWSIGYARNF